MNNLLHTMKRGFQFSLNFSPTEPMQYSKTVIRPSSSQDKIFLSWIKCVSKREQSQCIIEAAIELNPQKGLQVGNDNIIML